METVLLFVLAGILIFPAMWLTIGALENLLHPEINRVFTTEVMDMGRLRADYPDAYALVAYRRIQSKRLTGWAFRLVVAWELLAAVGLWVGTLSLAGAALGWGGAEAALLRGIVGATMFSATWMAFLVIGNWFCYWFGHEGAQNTHFQMTLWGLACVLLMMLGLLII